MKYILCLLLLTMLCGVGWYFYNTSPKDTPQEPIAEEEEEPQIENLLEEFSSDALGLSFNYHGGESGYVLLTPEGDDDPDLLEAIVLMDTQEYEILMQDTGAREGPPSINVLVFDNIQNASAEEWVKQEGFANYLEEVANSRVQTVDGIEGFAYHTTGLFEGEAVAVAHEGKLYFFTGNYFSPEDQIVLDFQDVLNSVEFL